MNFQTRDLARAADLLRGNLIFFGPETTNGANLPGPFYYILLLPAMLFNDTWRTAWWLMIFLGGISATIATLYFRNTKGMIGSLLFIGLYLLMPFATGYYIINLNPSYLFIFVVLSLMLGIKSFDQNVTIKRGTYFALACAIIGLGAQLHFSIMSMLLALILLQLFSKKLSLPKLTNKQFLIGISAFVLTTLPYFIWVILQKFEFTIGQQSSYPGIADKFNSTFLYLVKFGLTMPLDYMIISSITDFLRVLPLALLIFPLIFLNLSKSDWSKLNNDSEFTNGWQKSKILLIFTFTGLLPYLSIILIKIAHRYGMVLQIASLFLMVTLLFQIFNFSFLLRRYIWLSITALGFALCFVYFKDYLDSFVFRLNLRIVVIVASVIVGLAASIKLKLITRLFAASVLVTILLTLTQSIIFRVVSSNTVKASGNRVVRSHWLRIFRNIYELTGWTYSEAKNRLYVINVHDNNDLEPFYNEVVRNYSGAKIKKSSQKAKPDGILVAGGMYGDDLKSWLLTEAIHEDIKKAIRSGHLIFGEPYIEREYGVSILIAPYYVSNTEFVPKSFHSNGLYYKKSEDFDFLKSHPGPESVYIRANAETVFQWNECPDQHPYCNTAAKVSISKSIKNKVNVTVQVVGESLSQVSIWVHPNWTAAWDFPFIEVKCGEQSFRKILASSIGYKREYLIYNRANFFQINNSIIAPFEKRFEFPCVSPVEEIKVGRSSSTIDYLTDKKVLPKKELSIKLL